MSEANNILSISDVTDMIERSVPTTIDDKGRVRPDTSSPEMARVFDAVSRYFSLLSDPTRMKILHFSCQKKRSVTDIVEATKATQTNVSRHLALLHQAGLVSRKREGKRVLYWTRDPEQIKTMCHTCAHLIHKIKSEGTLQKEWVDGIQLPAEENIRLSA
jgi:Predicted transcriptional regulators